jgi:hypothetical protein
LVWLSVWVSGAAGGCGPRPLTPQSTDGGSDTPLAVDGGASDAPAAIDGDGPPTACYTIVAPEGTFTSLSAGNAGTCGIRTDGTLACWGYFYFDEPKFTTTYKDVSDLTALCAVRSSGTIDCWGLSPNVGAPPTGTFDQVVAAEEALCARAGGKVTCQSHAGFAPQYQFTSLTGGAYYMCGLLATDQSIVCWEPRVGAETVLVQPGPFTAVDAGRFYACGLRPSGNVECWQTDKTAPTATILAAPPPAGPFRELSTGEMHACALRDDDSVVCWGENYYGQATPPADLRLAHVSASSTHTCGIRRDGTVTCWGGAGECGRPDL